MKKILTSLITSALIFSALTVPFSATDDITQAVKYATPTIDGVIDSEYKDSVHIEHRWTKEKDNDKIWKLGKYSDQFEEREQEEYTWDCSADSYFLYDDYALYIAVDVTDNDYGCVKDETVLSPWGEEQDIDIYGSRIWMQDGIQINLDYEGMTVSINVDRQGKAMLLWEKSELTDLYYYINGTEPRNTDLGHCAVSETDTGYTVEMRIPLSNDFKSVFANKNSSVHYWITVYDSPSDSQYYWEPQLNETFLMIGFEDLVALSDGFTEAGLPGELSFTLGLTLKYGDINGDGEINVKDLTRLMKFISGEKIAIYNPDLNGDGTVNSKDLVRLINFCAGG